MDKSQLPLRIGVGIIVLNKQNKVFVGREKIILLINGKCPKAVLIQVKISINAMKRELLKKQVLKSIEIVKRIRWLFSI